MIYKYCIPSFIRYNGPMGKRALTGIVTSYVASEFRAEKGRLRLSLRDIEERTGLSRMAVDNALRGDSAIAIEAFVVICRVLDIDPSKLIRQAALQAESASLSGK